MAPKGSLPTIAAFPLALVLSGCLATSGPLGPADPNANAFVPVDPLWVADEVGDEHGFSVASMAYGPSCRIGCDPLPTPLPDIGGKAPFLDVQRVGLASEQADSFTLALELASLEATFAALDEQGVVHRVAEYYACWEPPGSALTRCAILLAAPTKDGPVVLSTFNLFGRQECNVTWKECAWDIPATLTYGTPGEIRFEVPKAYAAFDGSTLGIQNLRGGTEWFSLNKVVPMWHLAWTVRVPGDHKHDHVGFVEPAGVADWSASSSEVRTLTPSLAPPTVDPASLVMNIGKGNILGAGGLHDYAALDLVALRMQEEGDNLVVTFKMAALASMPTYDLQLALLIELSNGENLEVGVMQSNGNSYGYQGACISFGCHHSFLNRTPLRVVDDSYEIRFPLKSIGNPAAGVQTNWMLVYTMYGEANHDLGPGGEDGSVNVHSGSIIDHHVGGRPFVFAGHGEPASAGHQH